MWRLAVVLSLLWPSAVFGGQTRGQMQVGMIITGKSGSATIKPKAATGAKNNAAVPSPAEPLFPVIITGKSGSAGDGTAALFFAPVAAFGLIVAEPAKARSGSMMVRRNAVPAIP
jgi:hypothetical protein